MIETEEVAIELGASDRNYNVKEFEIENLINLNSNGNDIIFKNYE